MQGGNIGEVRGIGPEQNLDPYIGEVVEKKMSEFPDGKAYKKKSADMKRLTEIDKKNLAGENLNADDIRFLYEIDEKIEGFGYQRDPRIEEIRGKRDTKKELSFLLKIPQDLISISKEEALKGGIEFHYGSLYLESLTSAEGLTLPKKINGSLDLGRLTSAEGLTLPETINGRLYLGSLTSAEKNKLLSQYPHLKIF